ncbi:hypothetical protein [Halorubrum distributum]|uniref:hypothetical protein n=1 Tax=Halorubrum distributum TaxID=29283 RepID=UPI0012678022|nr:hypothetical protein [Halorubrum litoreum]
MTTMKRDIVVQTTVTPSGKGVYRRGDQSDDLRDATGAHEWSDIKKSILDGEPAARASWVRR